MDKQTSYLQVAMLHAANLDQGFLASLGVPFLGLMYRAIDDANDSVLLTEVRDGRVVGFVAGGMGMGPIYRQMLRHPFQLALTLMPSVMRPSRCKRILDVLRYGSHAEDSDIDLPTAELLSIAVDPVARGQGVAEQLYRRLEAYFENRGVDSFVITVGHALAPAHSFYQRMGARPVSRTEVHPGEISVVYVHENPGTG